MAVLPIDELKKKIDGNIYQNSQQAITGARMNTILNDMVDSLDETATLDTLSKGLESVGQAVQTNAENISANAEAIAANKEETDAKLTELEQEISSVASHIPVLKIENGGIQSASGKDYEVAVRCRTGFLTAPFSIEVGSDFKMMLFTYDADGVFINNTGSWTDSIVFYEPNTYQYRLIFGNSTDTEIHPADIDYSFQDKFSVIFNNLTELEGESLKTTEQTLTDEEKTRVVENLGLLPVSDIADNAVSPKNCTFFDTEFSVNIVDWDNLDVRGWSLTGAITSSSYMATDFIAIKPNTTYTINKMARIIQLYTTKYDFENKDNFHRRIENTNTFFTEESEVYVRLQFANANYVNGGMMMVEGTELPSEYIPYYRKQSIKNEYIKPYRKLTSIGSSGFDVDSGGQYQLTEIQKQRYDVQSDLTITKVLQVLLGYDEANICAYAGNTASQIFFKNGISAYVLKHPITLLKDKTPVNYPWNVNTISAQMTKNLSSSWRALFGTFDGKINGINVRVYSSSNPDVGTITLLDDLDYDVIIPAGSIVYMSPWVYTDEGANVNHGDIRDSEGLLLQIGANSEGATPEEIIAYFELAIQTSNCKWFVALRQNRDGASDLNNSIDLLRDKYGSRFIDHMAYLKTIKALQDQGITPTTSEQYLDANGQNSNPLTPTQIANNVPCDLECIATGQVPSSFWHSAFRDGEEQTINSSHFNAQGLECIGKYLYTMIKMLKIA